MPASPLSQTRSPKLDSRPRRQAPAQSRLTPIPLPQEKRLQGAGSDDSVFDNMVLLCCYLLCIAHYVMYSRVCSFLLGTTFRPKLPSRLTAAKARAAGFYVVMESTPDA